MNLFIDNFMRFVYYVIEANTTSQKSTKKG